MADLAHDLEVVADEEIGDAQPLLQVEQQVDDLRLDRHVEGGDRLVADQQVGLGHQGAREHDALALAAGKLVRVAVELVRLQADRVHHGAGALAALCGRDRAVDRQRLHDLHADRQAAIERAQRILVDHLQLAA